ncbi:histidine phosphatase family protein [Nannocystis pusilla]|uniref:histidine phosphatase family protein n=1 Tax=Nannocystis pusilla TaxID=889268 RepID=UPI003B7DB7B4
MLDLWLVRHAESLGNLDGSEADTCLSPRGRLQAAALAPVLAGESFDSVLSSPLQRALETAALALPGRAVLHASDLRELVVEPDRFVDVSRLTPAQLRDILRPPADVPPNETGKQFMTRVRSWLTALPPSGRVLAVTHAGVVRELLRVLFPDLTRTQPVGHAAISRVSITAGAPRLVMLDERRHLESLRPT